MDEGEKESPYIGRWDEDENIVTWFRGARPNCQLPT